MSKIVISFLLLAATLVACDEHLEYPDNSLAVCQILCTDGDILSFDNYRASDKEAIAVVFHVNHDAGIVGQGYAVYLWDLEPLAFSDTTGIIQNTSADTEALDGNANTYALYTGRDASSPLAQKVVDLWRYGQSAYVPSVAQMRYLKLAKSVVNSTIAACGGDILPDEADAAGTGLRRK